MGNPFRPISYVLKRAKMFYTGLCITASEKYIYKSRWGVLKFQPINQVLSNFELKFMEWVDMTI